MIDDDTYGGTLPFEDECLATGAEHVWTFDSSHPDRMYDRTPHCDECGASPPPAEGWEP